MNSLDAAITVASSMFELGEFTPEELMDSLPSGLPYTLESVKEHLQNLHDKGWLVVRDGRYSYSPPPRKS